MITSTISVILSLKPSNMIFTLNHLFSTYGNDSTDDLDDATDAVKKMQFSVTDPLTKLYTAIEDLEQLGQATESPFLPAQQIRIALRVIKSANDYTKGLLDWCERPIPEHRWLNLKAHFICAKVLLKNVETVRCVTLLFKR